MDQGKRTKDTTHGSISEFGKIGGPFKRGQLVSEYLKPRLEIYE